MLYIVFWRYALFIVKPEAFIVYGKAGGIYRLWCTRRHLLVIAGICCYTIEYPEVLQHRWVSQLLSVTISYRIPGGAAEPVGKSVTISYNQL